MLTRSPHLASYFYRNRRYDIAMMKRDEALKSLARHYPDGIVVAVYQSAFDWLKIRPHDLNYLCTGAMGQASSHGLGLALGAPREKVVVLDGDGSLLMNLGSLVTVANMAPKNFVHFVSQNNMYEVNGKYPIPGADKIRFDQMALGAGYRHAFSFEDINEFDARIEEILHLQGPVFVCMHIEPGAFYPLDYVTIHSEQARAIFRNALQSRLQSQLTDSK